MSKTIKKSEDRNPIEETDEGMFLTKVSAHKLFKWFEGYMQGEMEPRRFWYVLNFCRSANIETIDQLEDVLTEYEAVEEGEKEIRDREFDNRIKGPTKTEPKAKLKPTKPTASQQEDAFFENAALSAGGKLNLPPFP